MEMNQYQIVLVNLDTTLGSKINNTRPCVVISPNEMNKYLQTIIIAPITNTSKAYPTRLEIKNHKIKGWIVIDQVRTIDKLQVIKKLGELNEKELMAIKNIIKETFVD